MRGDNFCIAVEELLNERYPTAKTIRLFWRDVEAVEKAKKEGKPGKGHEIYPYLLKGLKITRPYQVWAADITYIPVAKGFLYLVAIIDLYSRYVLSWRISNTLDVDSCVKALEEALRKGRPEIVNLQSQGNRILN